MHFFLLSLSVACAHMHTDTHTDSTYSISTENHVEISEFGKWTNLIAIRLRIVSMLFYFLQLYHVNATNYPESSAHSGIFSGRQKHGSRYCLLPTKLVHSPTKYFSHYRRSLAFITVCCWEFGVRDCRRMAYVSLFSIQMHFDVLPPQPVNSCKFINYKRYAWVLFENNMVWYSSRWHAFSL